MERHYVNLINRDIDQDLLSEVIDAYNSTDEEIEFYLDTSGGLVDYAKAVTNIFRREKVRTTIHFVDECSSVGIIILQMAIEEGIANMVFPLMLTLHKARVEVQCIGMDMLLSEEDRQLARDIGQLNGEMETEPFYHALSNAQQEAYQRGEDVTLTSYQTVTYLEKLTKIINR